MREKNANNNIFKDFSVIFKKPNKTKWCYNYKDIKGIREFLIFLLDLNFIKKYKPKINYNLLIVIIIL